MESNKSLESHNIKSIQRMNEYLKRLFFAYLSIYNTFVETRDTILKIQNDLNFRQPDGSLIESYNKSVTMIYDQISGVLAETISDIKLTETFVINPVNFDKNQFTHKLEVSLFLRNMTCITKPIGDVSNVSMVIINDHLKLLRAKDTYDFVTIDNSTIISPEDFRTHLDKYTTLVKELSGLFYNDIEFTKLAFKNLLNCVSETIKINGSKCNKEKWFKLLTEIKNNADEIYNSLSHIDI